MSHNTPAIDSLTAPAWELVQTVPSGLEWHQVNAWPHLQVCEDVAELDGRRYRRLRCWDRQEFYRERSPCSQN